MFTNPPVCEAVQLKTPTVNDYLILEDFFARSLKSNFNYFPAEAHANYRQAWQGSALNNRLEKPTGLLVCAWHEEKIIGLVSGSAPEGGVASIMWVMVEPEYQSLGIGRRLVKHAKEFYAAKAHKIKLTVHDARAIKFYLREGFIQEAFHPKHWWQLDFAEMVFWLKRLP